MWELDHKEGWAPKNWCFWIVVLKKTLENPLDCKKLKPVNPKGNQSWIFIGRTDAEAPVLWWPDMKSLLIGKDTDAWKDWRQKVNQVAEDKMFRSYHQLIGHEFEQTPGDSKGQGILACCSPWSHKESDTTLTGCSVIKNPPANAGDVGRSLGWEGLLEKEKATHSSILAWKTPWIEQPGQLQFKGLQKSQIQLSN